MVRGIVEINHESCTKCLLCVKLCPTDALRFENDRVKAVDELCLACFGCAIICPTKAIVVRLDKGSYSIVQKDILTERTTTLDRYFSRNQERQPSSRHQSG